MSENKTCFSGFPNKGLYVNDIINNGQKNDSLNHHGSQQKETPSRLPVKKTLGTGVNKMS